MRDNVLYSLQGSYWSREECSIFQTEIHVCPSIRRLENITAHLLQLSELVQHLLCQRSASISGCSSIHGEFIINVDNSVVLLNVFMGTVIHFFQDSLINGHIW